MPKESKKKPGRPKKARGEQDIYPDAESYLRAVVCGHTPPDSARITAAKALLAYERPKVRLKPLGDPPAVIRKKQERSIEKSKSDAFEEKAAKVRAKFQEAEQCESR